MAETFGHAEKMGIGSTSTVDVPLVFYTEDIKKTIERADDAGITGTQLEYFEHDRIVQENYGGSISLPCTPKNLAAFLPYILGGNVSGTSFPYAETVPAFYISIDRGYKVFTYYGKLSKMTIEGKAGSKIDMTVEFVGSSVDVGASGSFPSLSVPTDAAYVFAEAALTLLASARKINDFKLTIDRMLDAVYRNALAPDAIDSAGFMLGLECSNPWDSTHYDLLEETGAAGSLVLTNGGCSCTWSVAKLVPKRMDPTGAGGKKARIPLKLDLIGKRTSSTTLVTVTNDSTP